MRETEDSGQFKRIPTKEFYTLKDVAFILDISERTMRQLLQSGEVHGLKLGGVWRIPHAEIQRLRAPKSGSHPPDVTHENYEPPDAPYGECS